MIDDIRCFECADSRVHGGDPKQHTKEQEHPSTMRQVYDSDKAGVVQGAGFGRLKSRRPESAEC